MDLADRGGIDSLSMRKLAEELGVEAMSLYYYVANKDDILAGMVDRVRSEIDTPSADAGWKAAIRRGAISAHDILLRHPWAGGLMVSARHISPARLGYAEWLLRRLREAGFSPEVTHHAYHALDGHIIGSALWEVGYPGGNDPADSAKAVALLRALPIDQYPYIAEHMAHHAKFSRADRNAFEFGLDLILDGLERIRGSPGASSG
jgi:AcrR family transcriptional regulator